MSAVTKVYRLREASKMTGIGYLKLLGAVKAGDLDHFKVGGREHRVTEDALNRFIKRLEQGEVSLPSKIA